MAGYYLVIFKNTHGAISGEKFLKEKGFEVVVMPTPTSITKSCGISLRIKPEDYEKVYQLIKNKELEAEKLYMKTDSGYSLIDTDK
jgi:hypothetical protein